MRSDWRNVPAPVHPHVRMAQRQEAIRRTMHYLPHVIAHVAFAIICWGFTVLCSVGAYLIYTEGSTFAIKADWPSEYALYGISFIVAGIGLLFLALTIWLLKRAIERDIRMKYKGIVEIMLKPDIPDVNGKALLASLKAIGFDLVNVRTGKVIEVEFECEPDDAPDLLERMAQELLAHPVTEQYAYRLQWIGERGFGETTMRYSQPPDAITETPMRYAVGEHDVRVHSLAGKVPKFGDCELLRAEWVVKQPRMVLVKYAVKGVEQPLGLRMDMDKKAFLDDLPDPSSDAIMKGMAYSIWDEILLGLKSHAPIEEMNPV